MPDLPSWKPETVDANEKFAKSKPFTVDWSKDCSSGRIFTSFVVLNTTPTIEYCTHMRSVLIVIGEVEVAKLVTVPAWLV